MRKMMSGKLSLGSVMVSLVALLSNHDAGIAHSLGETLVSGGTGNFYVGLNYSPAFSKVRDFEIRESNGDTRAVFPYKKDGKRVELKAEKFDWDMQNPRIGFKDNMLIAMEGSVGYGIGGARVEVEVGYERFKTRGVRDSGAKEDEGDTVYLLAKNLAHTVLTGTETKLKEALEKVKGEEIVAFAEALKGSYKEINEQICKGAASNKGTGKGNCRNANDSGGNTSAKGLDVAFPVAEKTVVDTWPHGKGGTTQTDNVTHVTEDILKLKQHEKEKVAGVIARSIEGGEVVEIRSVSSTSVMVNACYDLLSEGISVVPYACVGLGGSFVGVVDGHVTPKLAYKLKAGLGYQVTSEIAAYFGGFYHRVVGDGEYPDLPVKRLVDDKSPAGKTKDSATASFGLSYVGCELGVRFAF